MGNKKYTQEFKDSTVQLALNSEEKTSTLLIVHSASLIITL